MNYAASGSFSSPSRLSSTRADFPAHAPLSLGRTQPTVRSAHPSVSPLHSIRPRWYRNLCLLSIAYDSRPRLRPRLTLSGRTFLRKPWIFGGQDSHLPLATHANILSPARSTIASALASACARCSPTIISYPQLRYQTLAPFIFGAESLD